AQSARRSFPTRRSSDLSWSSPRASWPRVFCCLKDPGAQASGGSMNLILTAYDDDQRILINWNNVCYLERIRFMLPPEACAPGSRSEEHTSELQSLRHLV